MRLRPYEVYCGNTGCPSRQAGRTFKVIDTTDMPDATRAELMIEGVDSFKWIEVEQIVDGKPVMVKERIQTSKATFRFDGELKDGEIWLCPDCRTP
jgi:hypothetical protein